MSEQKLEKPMYKTDEEFNSKLAGTEYVVKSTSHETFSLWKEFHTEVDWQQEKSYTEIIGFLEKLPVNLQIQWEVINGHRILFLHMVSRVTDMALLENWIENHVPKAKKVDIWAFEFEVVNKIKKKQ